MNKTEFIRSMAEAKEITIKSATEQVDNVLSHLAEVLPQLELVDGKGSLNLTGYLKFTVKEVEAREARNPKSGETVQVDATRQVRVSAGTAIKRSVK